MGKSTDYHDYVFRDGKLIGQFEDMYKNSSNVPWHQDEQANWIDVRFTRELLRESAAYSEIHDIGCGTGHYLNLIGNDFLLKNGLLYGYDVSSSACKIAKASFPGSFFSCYDVTLNNNPAISNQQSAISNQQSKLIMIRGTLWYVFPKLTTVIENLASSMTPMDELLVVQNFPPLNEEFIGKDVLPNHYSLINKFSSRFLCVKHLWYDSKLRNTNDNWFVGIFALST